MGERKERFGLSLPAELAAKLRVLAAERHTTVSEVVAMALEEFFSGRMKREIARALREAELYARAAVMGIAALIDPENPEAAANRLIAGAVREGEERQDAGEGGRA